MSYQSRNFYNLSGNLCQKPLSRIQINLTVQFIPPSKTALVTSMESVINKEIE